MNNKLRNLIAEAVVSLSQTGQDVTLAADLKAVLERLDDHPQTGWQSIYGGTNEGQQYRCILCGAGGACGRGNAKPLTYHCHECLGLSAMWPTPQYTLYREQVTQGRALVAERDALREELTLIIASFDELAACVGFSEERLDQTGDSPIDCANQLQQRLTVAEQRALILEREFKKLRDVAHGCYQIASSYSGCIDGVEEHGGDDHEDPSCAIFHRLYYAIFDADAALKPAAEGEGS